MTEDKAERLSPEPADLVRRVIRLAAIPPPSSRVATAPAIGADPALIAACVAATAVAERKRALFNGPGRVDDDAARDAMLEPLDREQDALLEEAARAVPSTCAGHIARAATFLLWDAGALYREATLGSAGDRLLAAILHDLAAA